MRAIAALVTLTAVLGAFPSPGGATARLTACVVVAAPGSSDAALDASATAGAAAVRKLGVRALVFRPSSISAYVANLRACIDAHAALTIGVGAEMVDAVDAVATAFPQARLAIVDASVRSFPHRPANVVGLLFAQQQAGYLAGYAAGLWAKTHNGKAVGSVAGIEIPPVDRFIAGFQFGAKRADPDVKVLNAYAEDPSSIASCRSAAEKQIAAGSAVEFQVAGRCGLGVFAAARNAGIVAIGAPADQSAIGPWVLTSAVERVDVAVRATVVALGEGTLRTGGDRLFGAQRGGVGYGIWSRRVPLSIRTAVARQSRLLDAGKITGIPSTLG